jgi:hypothetical protein
LHGLCFYCGTVLRVVDNSGAINRGADNSNVIDRSSFFSLIKHTGAIDGGADDSSATDGSSDDCRARRAVWILQRVLGKQWRVLPRVQGIL